MLQTMTALQTIPVIDLRDGGPPRHARQSAEKARALRDACLGFFPRAALPLVPVLDSAARTWLPRVAASVSRISGRSTSCRMRS